MGGSACRQPLGRGTAGARGFLMEGGEAIMASPTTRGRADSGPLPEIPPLEPGDHLEWDEFERRYDAMPDLKKAELIEGVVYMPSPVRLRRHAVPHADLISWL